MKVTLYKGLTKEETEELKKEYAKAVLLRGRFKDVLEDKLRVAREKLEAKAAYDSPNWSLTQADQIGYNRAINDLIKLF